jgi:hypothetical protein
MIEPSLAIDMIEPRDRSDQIDSAAGSRSRSTCSNFCFFIVRTVARARVRSRAAEKAGDVVAELVQKPVAVGESQPVKEKQRSV